ncbi:MAG: nuclear transport factor 2 family protein [Gammaproteobacteria bacterium]|nr:nuclear transport factor 2 family protein [Gammaproteobacteria bacterium]MDP7093350.1 nuclear transport factor 2 family protein [Gammaproteobacteria bacterium]MDP7270873.1 nuclear transport factor 2 family protein [Gammaproteobacteria bacterium]HJP03926.1 nuclear transport factor 2 family protein [Gammaproteobacteria bacterium]
MPVYKIRLLVFFTGFLLAPIQVMADYHYQNTEDAIVADEEKLAGEISAFLVDYAEVYNNQNYRALKSMWYDDGNPIYMAEEVPFPLYGKQRLDNYLNPVPGKKILEGIDNRYSEVRAKYLTPDIAVATYRIDYDLKLVGRAPMGGWDRIMAVFRKADGEWKLTAYAEAPMGPMTMARKQMKAIPAQTDAEKAAYETTTETLKMLSEAQVSEGFDEFLAERKDLEPTH